MSFSFFICFYNFLLFLILFVLLSCFPSIFPLSLLFHRFYLSFHCTFIHPSFILYSSSFSFPFCHSYSPSHFYIYYHLLFLFSPRLLISSVIFHSSHFHIFPSNPCILLLFSRTFTFLLKWNSYGTFHQSVIVHWFPFTKKVISKINKEFTIDAVCEYVYCQAWGRGGGQRKSDGDERILPLEIDNIINSWKKLPLKPVSIHISTTLPLAAIPTINPFFLFLNPTSPPNMILLWPCTISSFSLYLSWCTGNSSFSLLFLFF